MADVVERRGGAVREARRAGAARLRRDQHDALAGARAIDRARGRALQDLDVLDVVGVQVDGAILHHGALTRVTTVVRVEARRRNSRVVDRHAIHHEQRLVVSDDRANAADLNERRCAGIAGLAGDLDVRGLGGERLDDVLLVAALDLVRRDSVADVAELLGRRRRAGAGHHYLTELQRVGGEREVLGDEPFGELHGDRLRLVAEAARGHLHRLARGARGRQRTSGCDPAQTARPRTQRLGRTHGRVTARLRGETTRQRYDERAGALCSSVGLIYRRGETLARGAALNAPWNREIAPPGLEPGFPDPKSGVLPLDEGAARRKLADYLEENIGPVGTPRAQLHGGAIAPWLQGGTGWELDDLREPLAHHQRDVAHPGHQNRPGGVREPCFDRPHPHADHLVAGEAHLDRHVAVVDEAEQQHRSHPARAPRRVAPAEPGRLQGERDHGALRETELDALANDPRGVALLRPRIDERRDHRTRRVRPDAQGPGGFDEAVLVVVDAVGVALDTQPPDAHAAHDDRSGKEEPPVGGSLCGGLHDPADGNGRVGGRLRAELERPCHEEEYQRRSPHRFLPCSNFRSYPVAGAGTCRVIVVITSWSRLPSCCAASSRSRSLL